MNADGTVRSARFNPPLKPEFQACAGASLAGHFVGAPEHLEIPVHLVP
jgi:hypothetical protein